MTKDLNEHFMINRPKSNFRVLDFQGETTLNRPEWLLDKKQLPPIKRYYFQVIDKETGKVQILSAGRMVAKQIFDEIAKAIKPKRNWLMVFLERLGWVKPLPDPEFHFSVEREFMGGVPHLPKYTVKRVFD